MGPWVVPNLKHQAKTGFDLWGDLKRSRSGFRAKLMLALNSGDLKLHSLNH